MLGFRAIQVQDVWVLREKEIVVMATTTPPPEFYKHMEYITALSEHLDDPVRIELLTAIETLVHKMNGPWAGSHVGWQWGDIPDNLASLFDEEEEG